MNCSCLQNCVDADILVTEIPYSVETSVIGADIVVDKYPLMRYKRKIIFTSTDFFGELNHPPNLFIEFQIYSLIFENRAVSVGGVAAFFTGICVLGVIEFIYFITIRLFWHLRGFRVPSPRKIR